VAHRSAGRGCKGPDLVEMKRATGRAFEVDDVIHLHALERTADDDAENAD
jgi:hypothetical protein